MKKKDQDNLNVENESFDEENFPGEDAGFPSQEQHAEDEYDGDREEDESEILRLKDALQEQKDKYLRLVAEFDNFRKRNSRERLDLIQTANKDVIVSLLDILDDVDRATEQIENTDDLSSVKQGVLLIFNKLKMQLQSLGLKEMDSLKADFDAELHDAITEIPAPSETLKGKVLDNIQKGYYLNDKLIRHAKVVVGK